MKTSAIILAGGTGKRMGTKTPKQFLLLNDRPVLWYSLDTFSKLDIVDEIVIVSSKDHMEYIQHDIVDLYGLHKVIAIVEGGRERYHSVANGLRAVSYDTDHVFIHDGARPFVSSYTIERCLHYSIKYEAAVAAVKSKDTIKIADDDSFVSSTPDRNKVWQVQTPQTFSYSVITEAYEKLLDEEDRLLKAGIPITDDTMVVKMFKDIDARLVESSYENIKITTPEDLVYAKSILDSRTKD